MTNHQREHSAHRKRDRTWYRVPAVRNPSALPDRRIMPDGPARPVVLAAPVPEAAASQSARLVVFPEAFFRISEALRLRRSRGTPQRRMAVDYF